ncbi:MULTISPECIES: zinc-ribbon domain-containing protein [unclassified Paenibacillus]|uniref:zinc-ribbon domain-containing protein n=1 Tax=unclassified Paenibacillus TaxID=185978 RepID=UPI0009A855F1|nr:MULTISPECIES: zinc-ribbon domain-containing protein [unclassified Paenibacillus]SLK16473.1 RNA polymerase, alpha chain C terminal domain [Paenibacillus sp. RU5A]SOC74386.1 RNA polymerase, alpha chain C terminal domain [Paenibacillus sp. RU26A]SOC76520.1 RNA polymerase, alpha chain C terminal domain [Paenibacillus sp. RU5M]
MIEQAKVPLSISHSDIAEEWIVEKNKRISPSDVTADSHRRAWWVCEFGHVEFNPVRIRVRDAGCAKCKSSRWKKEMEQKRMQRFEFEDSFKDLEHHPEMKLKDILKINNAIEQDIEILVSPKVEARIYNSLKRMNIHTIDELLEFNYDGLCRVRNLGDGSIRKLYEKLKDYTTERGNQL